MGNKDQRTLTPGDLKITLRKRDEQIAGLEVRIEAYIAQASEAQARLLKTIDILNSLKAQHVIDLKAKERETETLCKEVERWRAFAKVLEEERDDLRDVVEATVQKVEMSSDWNMWACSRLSITKHLHCLPKNNFKSSDRTDSKDMLEYGASVITRLRTELDHERKAHCKAVEEANLRIYELEAQVAVREAMLEECIRYHPKRETSMLDRLRQPQSSDSAIPPPKPMTDEDCLRVLADNNARNKSLEIEIGSLARKLERAQGTTNSPPFVPAHVLSVDPSSSPQRTLPNSSHQAASPKQPPISHESDTPLRSPPNVLPINSPVATRISSLDSPTTSLTYESQRSIAQLDDQINKYATQLETFKAERKALVQVAVMERRVLNGGDPPDFPQILGIEEECVRLASHVSQLELELEHSRSSARSREQELLKENNSLRMSLRQQSPLPYHPHTAWHLEDDIENMELATPLQPIAILSWNDPDSTSLHNDPLMVPLPFSPESNSSPIISPSLPLPRPSSPHPAKLRRLEGELELVRAQLNGKQPEELLHPLPDEPPSRR